MNRPIWYTSPKFIRKKSSHSWTDYEIRKVFDMRSEGVSVSKIIETLKLHVNNTQVYNVIRVWKKNIKGLCFQCGEELTQKDYLNQKNKKLKLCIKCQEKISSYKKNKRKTNIKEGKCGCCGHTRPLKNKATCMRCLSYTHRRRLAEGFCGKCGDKPISKNSTALCKDCLEITRKSTALSRWKKKILEDRKKEKCKS